VVVGDRKMAVFDDTLPWNEKLLLYPHRISWKDNIPFPDKAEPERTDIPESEPLRSECEHFPECIAAGQIPRTDGREGLRVLKVLNAGQRSLNEGGKICELSDKTANSELQIPSPGYFVHETSLTDEKVFIDKGTKVWHFSHILSGTRIGKNCNIGQNAVIGPDVTVGTTAKFRTMSVSSKA